MLRPILVITKAVFLTMTRKMLRTVIILATISLAGIMATQLFWVVRAFDQGDKLFTHNVNLALQNVVESLCNYNSTDYPGVNPVEQLSSNYFIVRTNNMIEPKVLEYFLKAELEKRQLDTPFEYSIFDCQHEKMVFGSEVRNFDDQSNLHKRVFPELLPNNYYFGVYFPEKPVFIAGQMGIWVFSTLVLFIVVIYFSYTIYVILRQRKLSEIQKDFINNMTHELRTPLATIAISAEVLKNIGNDQPERLKSYASIIENESQKLKNQVERVLEMVSLEKEENALRQEVVDIHEVIMESMASLKPQLEAKAGTFSTSFCESQCQVKGDRLHLSNIFFNLLDNAIKYCREHPIISIGTTNMGQWLHINITDNGIGIAPEDQPRVFDRFYRVPTGNVHNAKGFGIGLHYVKLIVETHGGSITLESRYGVGSTFHLTFPIWSSK